MPEGKETTPKVRIRFEAKNPFGVSLTGYVTYTFACQKLDEKEGEYAKIRVN